MKASYDKHHNELAFQVSDKVLLCLQPSRQASLSNRRHQKLLARFYGPFTILRRIGNLAYELNLPATSKLQPIFHVSLLEPYHEGHNSANPHLPPAPHALVHHPLAILDTHTRASKQELWVHWQHSWFIGNTRLQRTLLGNPWTNSSFNFLTLHLGTSAFRRAGVLLASPCSSTNDSVMVKRSNIKHQVKIVFLSGYCSALVDSLIIVVMF